MVSAHRICPSMSTYLLLRKSNAEFPRLICCSPLPYYIAAQARRGLEQSRPTNIHLRASVNAGKDYKVRISVTGQEAIG